MLPRHPRDSNPGLLLHPVLLDMDHELLKRGQIVDICKRIVAFRC